MKSDSGSARFFFGLLGGVAAGYAIYRTIEAARAVQTPPAKLPEDSKAYGSLRRGLMLAGILRSSGMLAAFAASDAPARLESAIATRIAHPYLQRCAFIATLIAADSLLELPIGYAEDFELERRFGLSSETQHGWLRDRVVGAALAIAISAPLFALAWSAIARWPKAWPWALASAAPPLLTAANLVLPLYVQPLFNTFEPYTGPLEARLRALAAHVGVTSVDILKTDMSKRTRKANAYVIGLFSTHRIVIGDTLLNDFKDDEIAFIVAHELGHYVGKDTWRGVALGSSTVALIAFLANALVRREKSGSAAHAMRLIAAGSLVAQALTPLLAAATRELEWAADRFALRVSRDPRAGIAAFQRLRERNLAEDEQPRWMELLFSTHPALRRRIAALQAAAT